MTSTHPGPAVVEAAPGKNILGLIALIIAIIGAIFACVPGALIVGWVLLPIAFILALVSLFLRGKKRGTGIAALILSVVGTVIGVIVFLAVVADAFDDAFDEETTVSAAEQDEDEEAAEEAAVAEEEDAEAPAEEEATEEEDAGAANGEQGTRDNPYALGSEISTSDWTVTVNSVDLDAAAAVQEENPYNEAPEEGHTYILADVTAQYVGDDAEGSTPMLSVAYVSPEGNTFESYDHSAVAPESFDSLSTLYEGASTSGNIALHVPVEGLEDGALSVSPGLFGDTVFVAVD